MKIGHAKFTNASEEVTVSRNFIEVPIATKKKVNCHPPIILGSLRNDDRRQLKSHLSVHS